MWIPNLEREVSVGEHESEEQVTLLLPLWKIVLLRISNQLLAILDVFDSEEPFFDFEVQPNETEKIRLFFFVGFIRRSKYYLILFSIIIGFTALDKSSLLWYSLNLQIYGLILDMVGAVVLALGLFRGVEGIERDATTRSTGALYNGRTYIDVNSLSAVVRKTADGTWGAFFLISGFTVQIIAIS